MTCAGVLIDDGTLQADLSGVWELGVSFAPLPGGQAILRFLAGNSTKQQRWRKESLTVTGRDRVPTDLRKLDYAQELTVTVTTGLGSDVYQCRSLGPREQWAMTGGEVGWSIVLEEA